jgi:ABC-type branched-subunit amino acid transport system ATPase component/ABC-type branched-subunit amino acid transport system permease subunit
MRSALVAAANRVGARLLSVKLRVVLAALLVGALLLYGFWVSTYWVHIGILAALMLTLAVSLRPMLVAGEASFCHGTFYALGAYTVAILTTKHGFPVWPSIVLGGFVAAVAAVGIGLSSLRASGAYFFLITFGFLVVINAAIEDAQGLTGGSAGLFGIPAPPGVDGIRGFYFVAICLAILSVAAFLLFDRSRWGLELRGLGSARELAQSAGASRMGNMMSAFSVGAFFAGLAGGVYATYVTYIAPASFSFWLSVYALTYVVLGGARYIIGAIVGTLVLAVVPIVGEFSEAYVAIFTAAVTLAIMLITPRGIVVEAVERARRFGIRPAVGNEGLALATVDVPAGTRWQRRAAEVAELDGTDLLTVEGLTKRFGGINALEDVNLSMSLGDALGIIGPNGAGKTTLFNAISGFTRPTAGTVTFRGRDVTGWAPHRIVQLGLTRTFQASSVFERLTVLENVMLACRTPGEGPLIRASRPLRADRAALRRAYSVLEVFDLREWAAVEAGQLPYGSRRTLGVAIAMATEPDLLCLDEPMAGLNEPEVEEMIRVLEQAREETGVSILLIEHRVPVVTRICDRIVALDFGRVIASGEPSEVTAHPAVIEAYIGQELEEVARG